MVLTLSKPQAKRLRALATQASGNKVADVDAALDAFEALLRVAAAASPAANGSAAKRARPGGDDAVAGAAAANGHAADAAASEEDADLYRRAGEAHIGWRVTVPPSPRFVEEGDEAVYLRKFGVDEVPSTPAETKPFAFAAVRFRPATHKAATTAMARSCSSKRTAPLRTLCRVAHRHSGPY